VFIGLHIGEFLRGCDWGRKEVDAKHQVDGKQNEGDNQARRADREVAALFLLAG
jgi:hypothetical protein